jgi:hypothetical protein
MIFAEYILNFSFGNERKGGKKNDIMAKKIII